MYARALQIELAKASPLDYAEHTTKGTQRYAHTLLLSSLIVRLVQGKLIHPTTRLPVRKLAVSMPPRHGKSYVISEHTPAWALTKYAHLGFRVGLASYEAEEAEKWGKLARDHVSEHPEFGALLNPARRASNNWELLPINGAPRSGMNTAGVGGPFTGKGFHLLIIDDPIKDSAEAMSATIRENKWNWIGSTALTRLEPTIRTEEGDEVGHAVILVNTRWHEDDLMGRVLKNEPDAWYHLNLKALADDRAPEGDALNRQPGEALCPGRYTAEELAEVRDSPVTGGYHWSAMYQGEPNIEGGGIFKKASFRYHRPAGGDLGATQIELRDPTGASSYVPRAGLARFSTLDTAATVKTSSDWSVLLTFEVTPDRRLLLIDLVRQRLESADLKDWVHGHYARLAPSYIGVGATTFGLTLITELRRLGVPVRPLPEKEDKISRALTAGSLIDAGRIFFPEPANAPWISDFEHELLQFPKGAHDDQVDVLAHGAREVAIGPWSTAAQTRTPEDTSIEARIARYLDAKHKGRKARRHPELGKL